MPGYVEEELRGYLECGILCFGFASALCTGCRTGFVVAFSCKGRKHRHRYHGVFAPNHKLRRAVTALAIGNVGKQREAARPINPAEI